MIDIILPVYNSEKYINESISSILAQTYDNFRLLVFNDASTDNTKEIIRAFNDKRIIYFESKQNIGCAKALNTLLMFSDAKYIARMDADDIALEKRLETQFNFMESNPEYVLCGTWLKTFGYEEFEVYYPVDSEEIRVHLLSYCCIGHPTVMFRNGTFQYDSRYEYAEDYHAWAMLSKDKRNLMANIPAVLLEYRLHTQQISALKNQEQFNIANKIKIQLLNNLSKQFTEREISAFLFLVNVYSENGSFTLSEIENFIEKVLILNNECKLYDNQLLKVHLQNCLKKVVEDLGT